MKFENTEVWGFEHALRGMRNPMNSWSKNDTYYDLEDELHIGDNDLKLAQQLIKAGSEHRKFMRQIFVSVDITAPLYWIHEFDTYKVGVSRNSCSMQHKGVSKPFSIRDFDVDDKRIYEVLAPPSALKKHELMYHACGEDDYKLYSLGDRQYKVYKNGKIIACAFRCEDTCGGGRTRVFKEREVRPYQNTSGYWAVRIGGRRYSEHWFLHRLVAYLWLPTNNAALDVNHIDGNKGNNDVSNLEWLTRRQNMSHAYSKGLIDSGCLSMLYKKYKNSLKCDRATKEAIKEEYNKGVSQMELAKKYDLSQSQISAIISSNDIKENTYLFDESMMWERIINCLNELRALYLATKDYKYFRAIRQLIPMSYNYKFTATMSYENIYSMVHQRKNHKLNEWSGCDNPDLPNFISWAKTLPYAQELLFI